MVFGSIERFIGILIEHYAGKFPLWLSPVQVRILPVSDKFADYAAKVQEELKKKNIRVELDERNEKLGYKIREARNDRIPYMLIVGGKEEEQGMVSVRKRDAEGDKQDLGMMSLADFCGMLKKRDCLTRYRNKRTDSFRGESAGDGECVPAGDGSRSGNCVACRIMDKEQRQNIVKKTGGQGMKIIICDDEPYICDDLKKRLTMYYNSMDVLILTVSSGEELLRLIEREPEGISCLFLDIEMGGIDGLETARRIRKHHPGLPILLLTSHTELAMEGYEVQAFRFLAKPLRREKLTEALRAVERELSSGEKLRITADGREIYVDCRDICYVKSENVYLNLVMAGAKRPVRSAGDSSCAAN